MTTKNIPVRPIGTQVFCGANKTNGDTCRKPAGHSTNHPGIGRCKFHGGNTPNHNMAAQLAQARDVATIYGVPRDIHPIDGLMEEYWRTAGLVDVYEAMCMQLLPNEVVWGVQSVEETTALTSGTGSSDLQDNDAATTLPEKKTKAGAGVHTWVKLFNEERDRFSRLAEQILKLDLASRQVEYTQSQVAALVAVLLAPELALSEDQRRTAARLLRGMDQPVQGEIVGAT